MVDREVLRDLFDRAVSLPPRQRAAFLANECGTNLPLRAEIERLLAADAGAASIFDSAADESGSGSHASPPPSTSSSAVLPPGTRLGSYVIEEIVGAGGMGEVYRARDTRLGRAVAIKVLPLAISGDPTARHRFEREARAVAALSHSHICPLFDVGRDHDRDFLVMEFLMGETLASRLSRGRLDLREALNVAVQITSALAAAHRAGIIHRDLKPGNIMLTESGVRLLDFGLARQSVPATDEDTTFAVTGSLTGAGMMLGTPMYMAPEQIEGRQADVRTDVFALGVVLYEMVSGRRPFGGASQAALIGSILRDEPQSLAAADPTLPTALDDLVRHCLAKNRADRWPTMADVRTRLEQLQRSEGEADLRIRRAGQYKEVPRSLAIALVALVSIATGAGWWWSRRQAVTGSVSSPTGPGGTLGQRTLTRLTFDEGLQTDATFSPDGRFFAYASDKTGNFDVWVQPVAGGDAVQVTRSPFHETQPDWSPDGSTLVFRSSRDGGGLFTAPALGGPDHKIADFGYRPRFSPDGKQVLFVDSLAYESQRISPRAFLVAITGGVPKPVGGSTWAALGWIQAIDWHPDGRISVLSVPGGAARADRPSEAAEGQLTTMPADGVGAVRSEIPADVRSQLSGCRRLEEFRWNAAGDQVVVVCQSRTTRNIWAVAVDSSTLSWLGPVQQLTVGGESDYRVASSRSGSQIAFTNQRSVTRLWHYRLDERSALVGSGRPVTPADFNPASFALSLDGRTLTYSGTTQGSRQAQLWTVALDSGQRNLVNQLGPIRASFRHSSTGRTCYVRRDEDGRFRIVYAGPSDSTEHVVAESVNLILPFGWSPDGDAIVGSAAGNGEPFSIVAWPVTGIPSTEGRVRRILSDRRFSLWNGNYSPNTRWICFSANTGEAGGVSVIGLVAADGRPDRPWARLTSDRTWSDHPQWANQGSALLYVTGYSELIPNVWAFRIDPGTGQVVGPPHQVTPFDGPSRSLSHNRDMEIRVENGRLVAPVTETTGSIWMLDTVDR